MKNKQFIFRSTLPPDEFIDKAMIKSNGNFIKTDEGFSMYLNSDHGGKNYFKGNIYAYEDGCEIIGEIITEFYSNEKETTLDKISFVISFIIFLPLILVIILVVSIIYGIGIMIDKIKGTYVKKLSTLEILLNFMVDNMCCNAEKQ